MLQRSIYTKIRIANAPSDAIRLCSIKSELSPPAVWCALQSVELHNAPEYAALSYAWRAPLLSTQIDSSRHIIICSDEELHVHDNLFHALLRLGQPPYRGHLFWIDAICIDQDNTEERSHQVNLMSDVYRKAHEVIVWLGPDDAYTVDAIRLIQGFSSLSEQARRTILPHTMDIPEVRSLLQPDLWKKHYWIALAHLLRRTWFSRAWVIQEVLLAQNLIVLCGFDAVLVWEQLETVSHHLCTSPWRRKFIDPTWLGFDNNMPHYNSPANLRAAKRDLTADDALLRSLIRSRKHDCRERIDKVFCLYGIASLHTPEGVIVPKANYRLSEAQAYTDAAMNVLRSSNELHILAHAEGARFRNIVDLPSWVPDWSVKELVGIGVTGHKRYWPAGDLPKTAVEFPKPGILRLSAALVGYIRDNGESKKDIATSKRLYQSFRLLHGLGKQYCTGEPIMEAFWRTLLYDTSDDGRYPARGEIGESFKAWLSDYLTADDATSAKHIHLARSLIQAENLSFEATVDRERQKQLFDHYFHLRQLLRMFVMDNGILGLGSESLEPGDSVWIIPGSRMPLAFRKYPRDPSRSSVTTVSQPDCYELVGCAYLHGFMHGQALDPGVPHNGQHRPLVDQFRIIDLK